MTQVIYICKCEQQTFKVPWIMQCHKATGLPFFYTTWYSLEAQLVRIRLQGRRPQFDSWVGKIRWRRDKLSTPVFFGFPGSLDGKETTYNVKTWVWFLGWEFSWRRKQLSTPEFWPGEFHGQRNLAGYSPCGCKELDITEWLNNKKLKL